MDEFELNEVLTSILVGECEIALGMLHTHYMKEGLTETDLNNIKLLTEIAESVIIFMEITERHHEKLVDAEKGFDIRFIRTYLN